MLERNSPIPYAVSVLTKDAKEVLLRNNINFALESFAFIDDESNYNLVNDDQYITVNGQTERGWNRINSEEADVLDDLKSLSIFEPNYRMDNSSNFLFGDVVGHKLQPSQIRNMQDVVRDITDAPITDASEIPAARRFRKYDFKSIILSGSIQDFYLSDSSILTWSVAFDIRGVIYAYQDADTFVVTEDGKIFNGDQEFTSTAQTQTFSKLTYIVEYTGDSADKTFRVETPTSALQPFTLNPQRLISDLKLSYEPYGHYTVYKQFAFEDKTFTSDIIEFNLSKQNAGVEAPIVLDGKNQILDLYTAPHDRKNVFVSIPQTTNQITEAKVYGNSLIDSVLHQNRLNGYLQMNPVIRFGISASKLNNLNFEFQNIITGKAYKLFSLIGEQITSNGFLTIQEFNINLTMYKHLFEDGNYHLITRFELVPDFGYLKLSDTNYNGNENTHYEYSLFGNKIYKLNIDIQNDIVLGTKSYVETLNERESLFHFYSPDQNLVFNFPYDSPVMMSDYENLIIDLN